MYNYNNWGWGWGYNNYAVRGTDDPCNHCSDGKVGCGFATYHNNVLLGSCNRPVLFTKLERRCIDGKEIDILISEREFFDRLRYDCTMCRDFYASICVCIEFGDTRPVFLSDGKCEKLLPLETNRNGYIIHADQIQPFADSMKLLKLTACFDPCNDHVTISNYYKKHAKCDCRCKSGCKCDGYADGYNGDTNYTGDAEYVDGAY